MYYAIVAITVRFAHFCLLQDSGCLKYFSMLFSHAAFLWNDFELSAVCFLSTIAGQCSQPISCNCVSYAFSLLTSNDPSHFPSLLSEQ